MDNACGKMHMNTAGLGNSGKWVCQFIGQLRMKFTILSKKDCY